MAQTLININGDVREASSLQTPNDRTFRGAWLFNGSVVEVDMKLARDIHRDVIRQEREAEFEKLDAKWFLAMEKSDEAQQAAIAVSKQKLRDAPDHPSIDAAKTPEELKALTLAVLTA